MKKIILFCLFSIISYAQVPQGMSHRGTAYSPTGVVLPNRAISIRVRILNGNPGTLVYTEKHNLTTNNNGQYNINIGQGLNPSPLFSTIDWSVGNKWLEIGIDPNNGTNYTVVGSSQLMSVPYALYAEKSNSNTALKVVNNINELRNYVGIVGDLIYVKGHTVAGDGGGGNFIWRTDSKFKTSTSTPAPLHSIDNDGTIIQAKLDGVVNDSGRWVRQFDGFIDVRFFGVFGMYSINNTRKIQTAIDFASINTKIDDPPTKGTTVFFPEGGYIVDKIILRNGVSLIGDSLDKTLLQSTVIGDEDFNLGYSSAYTFSQDYNNNGSIYKNEYFFEMESGPVQIAMSNFNISGRGTNKGCFYFEAKNNGLHGGLWNSVFKNIKINRFKGNGIYSKGGGTDGNIPNQFLIFENVRVARITDTSNALKMSGQHGQITFLNCQFDGTKNCEECTRSKSTNVQISHDNLNSAAVISFINSTFQDSDYGISVDYAENITIDNCWFESLGIAINIDGTSHRCKGINIVNNRFVNAAGFGSLISPGNILQGRCINLVNSQANISNNYVGVSDITAQSSDDSFVLAANNANDEVTISGNTFSDFRLGTTSGIMQTTSVSSVNYCTSDFDCNLFIDGINTNGKKIVFVQNSGSINRINSTINAQETILIRANGGNLTFYSTDPTTGTLGRNIYLNGRTSLTLAHGQSATFIKIDNSLNNSALNVYEKATYQLVSTTQSELTDSNWKTSISFLNGVTNYDANSTIRYRKKNGVVYLEGAIKLGTTQTNGLTYKLFQLPVGFRPSRKCSYTIIRAGNTTGTTPTSTVVGRVDIDTSGFVYGVNYSNIWSSLSGISFVVD